MNNELDCSLNIVLLKNDVFASHIMDNCLQFMSKPIKFFSFDSAFCEKYEIVNCIKNIELDLLSIIDKEKCQIIIPNLKREDFDLIGRIKGKCIITWILYGTEIFSLPHIKANFVSSKTRRFIGNYILMKQMYTLGNLYSFRYLIWILRFGKYIDRIAMWIDEDINYVKNIIGLKNIEIVDFCLSPELIDQKIEKKKSILIGASGNYNLNHLDAIDYVKSLSLKDVEYYLIMSYPKETQYMKDVKAYAKSTLGEEVKIVEEFIPYDDYSKLLASFDIVVFANIVSMMGTSARFLLKNRVKLVMQKNCNMHKKFCSLGMQICTLDDDVTEFYSSEILERNSDLIEESFGENARHDYYNNLLNFRS